MTKWIISLYLLLFNSVFLYSNISEKDLKYVMPSASTFTYIKKRLPYYKAFKDKKETGICYLSSDVVPEITGYNGPLTVLIGLDQTGHITGIKVLHHMENNAEAGRIITSFFDRQFRGKKIHDEFKVFTDIDNISGATITVQRIAVIIKRSSQKMYNYCLKKEGYDYSGFDIDTEYLYQYGNENSYKKVNGIQYVGGGILFLILLFTAVNIRFYIYSEKKRKFLYLFCLFEIGLILMYVNFFRTAFQGSETAVSINKPASEYSGYDSLVKPSDKPLLLNPKWGIQSVDRSKIRDNIKTGNLSDKEADHYQSIE